MASYLILSPSAATGDNLEKTRFIRDGFSLPAFLFPVIWFLWHRLWLGAVVAFLIQGIGLQMLAMKGLMPAGCAAILAVHIVAALEGPHMMFSKLYSLGWRQEGLLSAPDLAAAEDIYFSDNHPAEKQDIPVSQWDMPATPSIRNHGSAFGLPGYDGGR
jgi:hypothetical protein